MTNLNKINDVTIVIQIFKKVLICTTYLYYVLLCIIVLCVHCCYVVGPCHHGMARPQVADRGTASDKEGSCE